jgi:hypothetical protein
MMREVDVLGCIMALHHGAVEKHGKRQNDSRGSNEAKSENGRCQRSILLRYYVHRLLGARQLHRRK